MSSNLEELSEDVIPQKSVKEQNLAPLSICFGLYLILRQ